jgi:hypothetical protein
MQTASTRPCDSENRTDRNPIEDRRTSGLKSPRELRAAAATDTIDYAPVDTPLPASAACATDPAVTAAVPNAIWRNIVIAASYLDVT